MGTSVFPVGGVVRSAVKVLTNTQVVNLPTTPITLISAPSAGHVLCPQFAVYQCLATTDYSSIDANAQIKIGVAGNDWMLLEEAVNDQVSGLLANGGGASDASCAYNAPTVRVVSDRTKGQSGILSSDWGAKALILSMDNGATSSLGGGNAANTLTITVAYYLLNSATGQFE